MKVVTEKVIRVLPLFHLQLWVYLNVQVGFLLIFLKFTYMFIETVVIFM